MIPISRQIQKELQEAAEKLAREGHPDLFNLLLIAIKADINLRKARLRAYRTWQKVIAAAQGLGAIRQPE